MGCKHALPTMPINLNRYLGKYRNSNVQSLESLFMAWQWQKHQIKSANSHIVGTDKVMTPPIELLKC